MRTTITRVGGFEKVASITLVACARRSRPTAGAEAVRIAFETRVRVSRAAVPA